ncbi:protein sorting system archaetidylserine synthase [Halomarina litorea]|uniref:protein sorting system archaetidylserine synthase n=1 Tax=Halomarina litorea TaxID=2961595 RepID=UPI0020C4014E|nr:protein sorting system archaetidylserine synthase [Halomarina sp. BCD28]
MMPRFVGRLGPADAVTVANAALGFAAAAAVLVDPGLAARLVLLAAVADGLDGVLARETGGTEIGPYLDALADVASFCVAPALFVFAVAADAWGAAPPAVVAAVAVPALFVAMGVVRLGMYTIHDPAGPVTVGVPTTLAATVLAALYLAGVTNPTVLLGLTGVFAYLMVTSVEYPDLYARDALVMGAVQVLAVAVPGVLGRAFPRILLAGALGYLVLGPRFYWRDVPTRSESGPADRSRAETHGPGEGT